MTGTHLFVVFEVRVTPIGLGSDEHLVNSISIISSHAIVDVSQVTLSQAFAIRL